MNILVTLFFLHNVLATTYLGSKFSTQKDGTLKNFGISLLLNAIAFSVWSFAIITQAEELTTFVTIGVAFFITSLVFLLNAGIQNVNPSFRSKLLLLGSFAAVVLFYLRTFIIPAKPFISNEGFFFFNVHPLTQMVYIFALLLTSVMAINAVASKFKGVYSAVIRFCFLIQVIGGIILLTTTDTEVLYLSGWIMGTAYVALWAPLLLNKKTWSLK